MRQLDDTDLDILQLLMEDARRPFSDIADYIGLSAPAVSDRMQRMEDMGVITGFTVQLDRSKLEHDLPVMIEIVPRPGASDGIRDALGEMEATEHLFQLYDGRLIVTANAPTRDVYRWLENHLTVEDIDSYQLHLISIHDWHVGLGPAEFAVECVVCGNTVGPEGETARIDGDIKSFCCPSCKEQYLEEYQLRTENA